MSMFENRWMGVGAGVFVKCRTVGQSLRLKSIVEIDVVGCVDTPVFPK